MTFPRYIALPILAAGVLLAVTGCSQSAPAQDVDPIVGEWTMTTLETAAGEDWETVPYSGQVVFTDSGTMAVQAMNPDTDAPDTPLTVSGYEAYYGPVTLDPEAGTFEVEIESAAARDIIGETFTRNYEVTDDTLVLTPTDEAEGWRVTYERAG